MGLSNESSSLISFLFHKLGESDHADSIYTVSTQWLQRLIDQAVRQSYVFARWDQLHDVVAAQQQTLVTITFDDGFASDLTEALPLLQAHSIPATCFIVPTWIGRPGHLTWADVRTLAAANVAIGSHTMSHAWLPELSARALNHELLAARQIIEDQIGMPVRLLSIPGGFYNWRVINAAITAGYTIIGTSNFGIDRQVTEQPGRVRLLKRNCIDLRTPWDLIDNLLHARLPAKVLLQTRTKRLLMQMIGPSRYRRLADLKQSRM